MNELQTLPALAVEINREYGLSVQAAHSAVQHALRCGELLLQAKTQVNHGEWLPWLKDNCHVGARQAQKWMKLAKHPELKNESDSHLTIDRALATVAEKDDKDVIGRIFETQDKPDGLHFPAWGFVMTWEEVAEILYPPNYSLLREDPADCWPFLEDIAAIGMGEATPLIEYYVTALTRLKRTRELRNALFDCRMLAAKQALKVQAWIDENAPDMDAWLADKEAQIAELEAA